MTRRIALVATALVIGGLVAGWVFWLAPTRNAVAIGTAMLAKQMCSCVFIAERDEAQCRADQFSSMDAITVEISSTTREVRAFVPMLGERRATHSEDLGCTLQ